MPLDFSAPHYNKALTFAAQAHQGQTVPGTDLPYLLHLTRVAMETMLAVHAEADLDKTLAVHCAFLHDTVEDTKVDHQQLLAKFGPALANGVAALTKNKSLTKTESMADSLARIQKQPREIWLVKMADRFSNLGAPPPHWDLDKIQAYLTEARIIHTTLRKASRHLDQRLAERITQYRNYVDNF